MNVCSVLGSAVATRHFKMTLPCLMLFIFIPSCQKTKFCPGVKSYKGVSMNEDKHFNL